VLTLWIVNITNCVLHLLDIHPKVSALFTAEGGLEILVDHYLSNIQFMEVAENVIKILERVAQEARKAVLTCNCVTPLVNFFDFFDQQIQQQIVSILMYLSSAFKEPAEWKQYFKPAVPLLA